MDHFSISLLLDMKNAPHTGKAKYFIKHLHLMHPSNLDEILFPAPLITLTSSEIVKFM